MASRLARAITQIPVASSSRLFATTSTPIPSSSSSSTDIPSTDNTSTLPPLPFTYNDYTGPDFPIRTPLRKTHGIKVASVVISAHYPYKLTLFSEFAWHTAQSLGIPTAKPTPLKKSRELITVLKAPFVYKKYQENFERRHVRREIVAYDANREMIDLWLRYLREHDIGGLGIDATVYEWVEPGFAREEMGVLEEKLDGEVEKEAQRLLQAMSDGRLRLDGNSVVSAEEHLEPEASLKNGQEASPEAQAAEPAASAPAPTEDQSPVEQESVEERSKGETESATTEDLPKA